MARSLASCGCIALSVALGLGVLGAGAAWFALPGDGLQGKIESLVESMQPVGFEVVDVVPLEGGGCDLQIEASPLGSWDITSLQVGEVVWRWHEEGSAEPGSDASGVERTAVDNVSVPGEIQTRPPLLAGRDPSRFVVRFPLQPPEDARDLRVRFRVDVSALKHGGTSKVNLGYDETLRMPAHDQLGPVDAAPVDAAPISEPSAPR